MRFPPNQPEESENINEITRPHTRLHLSPSVIPGTSVQTVLEDFDSEVVQGLVVIYIRDVCLGRLEASALNCLVVLWWGGADREQLPPGSSLHRPKRCQVEHP